MTSISRSGGWFTLAVLSGVLFLLGRAVAAEPDLIKETQERLRVEAQRLETIVSTTLSDTDKIGRSQPARAIELLRAAKAEVDADKEALKPDRREALSRQLHLRIRTWEEVAGNRTITPAPVVGDTRHTDDTRRQAEQQRVRDEMSAINDLRRAGKTAARRADALAAQNPSNPSAQAASRIGGARDALASADDIREQRARGFLEVNKSILRSSIPEYRDIAYPRDWAEKMRKRSTGIQLTDTEKKIVKALGTTMTIDVEGKTFKEVLDYLKEKTGMPIVVDQRALDDLNLTYNTPINLNLKNVTTRTVLKRLLGDLQMTYLMKDETVLITTPERAKAMLSTRVYSVADLMPAVDMRLPPLLQQAQAYQTLQQLVVLITQTVEPDSWEVNGKGGLGTIQFDPLRFMLIVRQTAEMHYLLGLSTGGR